jgi:type III restriction enzyme
MKFELKPFQETAVQELLKRLGVAQAGIAAAIPQAIVLSSPTGSGKTVTMAGLLERVVSGGATCEANPRATFLWVSDSPELNAQSLDKIYRASDAFPLSRLIPVDAAFDQEVFSPGYLYFINTSKLGREKLLTTAGDKRTWTFWQTVANTAAASPQDFIVILDEAHRGMVQSTQERNRARTIVQKLILGSDDDGLPRPGAPLVVGMSATPQRFDELLAGTDRSKSTVRITVDDVRTSGLLKELVLVQIPSNDRPGDLTLLEEAARRWKDFERQWRDYCIAQGLTLVRPVLVVQVEDGQPERKLLTNTNLAEAIQTIERVAGRLSDEEYAHCFQEDGVIELGGRRIRKVEASRIQDELFVRVVFFKMSLTTGWDCPRAEVMMSFRKARDHTLIAQLVGRMIRAPLSRRIEGSEVLNTVELFLPHYDSKALDIILEELRNPDAESGLGTDAAAGRDVQAYARAASNEVFSFLESLPSYSIGRVPELAPVKRLMRFAARLTLVDELDPTALDTARNACLTVLLNARLRLRATDPDFVKRVQDAGELEVTTVGVQVGSVIAQPIGATKIALTPENIDDLFDRCGRVLGVGEGLHKEFWKRLYDPADPYAPKLELHELITDAATLADLSKVAADTFDELYRQNRIKLRALSSSAREPYNQLIGATREPVIIPRTMPLEITARREGEPRPGHIYATPKGQFFAKLNTWERRVIEEEMQRPGFVGWLRNTPRKEWALAVPYDDRGVRAFYPDFIFVRREDDGLVADVIDPHDSTRDDTWAKAKGLAEYALRHGDSFGRLEIAILVNGLLKRMDLNDPATRKRALRFQSNNDVDALFR